MLWLDVYSASPVQSAACQSARGLGRHRPATCGSVALEVAARVAALCQILAFDPGGRRRNRSASRPFQRLCCLCQISREYDVRTTRPRPQRGHISQPLVGSKRSDL
eukprot:scaffold12001_cov116-Isochrysis_galbana.AAC.22